MGLIVTQSAVDYLSLYLGQFMFPSRESQNKICIWDFVINRSSVLSLQWLLHICVNKYSLCFQESACSLLHQAWVTPPGSAWSVSAQLHRPTRWGCWPSFAGPQPQSSTTSAWLWFCLLKIAPSLSPPRRSCYRHTVSNIKQAIYVVKTVKMKLALCW